MTTSAIHDALLKFTGDRHALLLPRYAARLLAGFLLVPRSAVAVDEAAIRLQADEAQDDMFRTFAANAIAENAALRTEISRLSAAHAVAATRAPAPLELPYEPPAPLHGGGGGGGGGRGAEGSGGGSGGAEGGAGRAALQAVLQSTKKTNVSAFDTLSTTEPPAKDTEDAKGISAKITITYDRNDASPLLLPEIAQFVHGLQSTAEICAHVATDDIANEVANLISEYCADETITIPSKQLLASPWGRAAIEYIRR